MAQQNAPDMSIYFFDASPVARAAENLTPELFAAIVAVMGDVGPIPESGGKPGASIPYKYLSEREIVPLVRHAMGKHGLAVVPVAAEPLSDKTLGKMTTKTFRITFRIVHAGGGSMLGQTVGEGFDSGDKTVYKVMTGAYKYFLRQTFALSNLDDPDDTPSPPPDQPAARQAQQRRDDAPRQQTPDEQLAEAYSVIAAAKTEKRLQVIEDHSRKVFSGSVLADTLARVNTRRRELGFATVPDGDDPDDIVF